MKAVEAKSNILQLFKNDADADIILSRLHAISDILNQCEEDIFLDQVHNKVLEAIDWYHRYCDEYGYQVYSEEEESEG